MQTVYIETTIPSTYFELRADPKTVARRDWTREWWDRYRREYDLTTSIAVTTELARGAHPNQSDKLDLVSGLRLLPIASEVGDIVDVYISRFLMPNDPTGDALHLALASHYKCDVLLTWNCEHLANLNKQGHIRNVNTALGLHVPDLVTPLALLQERHNS